MLYCTSLIWRSTSLRKRVPGNRLNLRANPGHLAGQQLTNPTFTFVRNVSSSRLSGENHEYRIERQVHFLVYSS